MIVRFRLDGQIVDAITKHIPHIGETVDFPLPTPYVQFVVIDVQYFFVKNYNLQPMTTMYKEEMVIVECRRKQV